MDFSYPAHVLEIAHRVRRFVDTVVIPHENGQITVPLLRELRAQSKAEGLWAPTMPRELGGLGLTLEEWPPVLEAAGRSLLGPLALGCAAPDEGNMHLLHMFANEAQQEQLLKPLVAGEIFSGFSMTEPPPGAGSDPTMIRTTAVRDGDEWVVNGHKWFTSNGEVASFLIIMARSNPDVSVHKGCTLFLAPIDAPGIEIKRDVPLMTHDFGGHSEIVYTNLRVPHSAILGKEGEGFALSQARLGPARLTHCMRWTGIAQRAMEIAADYASEREGFGGKMRDHQAIQWMLADSAMEIHAGRLMIQHAAYLLAKGEQARQETSMAKVHVAETVNRVLDRAIQICGATGLSRDLPLSHWFAAARAFRIYDGASEVHRMVIARQVFKVYAGTHQD